MEPRCKRCDCYLNTYLNETVIKTVLDQELETKPYAAIVIHMFSLDDGIDEIQSKSRLCYGVPNRFLSVLVTREVEGEERTEDISFTITSFQDRDNTVHITRTIGE